MDNGEQVKIKNILWQEKYRPSKVSDVISGSKDKVLSYLKNHENIPNFLFCSATPGTGKTTTIINLINAYQEKQNNKNKDLIIHLNASDERGIDIIRNQINFFVNSKPLFNNGMKFVILDEVDYMTKNAQQALRYLLQNYTSNVRFCLICNYISKIDESLKNEFISIRFNQLPIEYICNFLKKVSDAENLEISDSVIMRIQQLYQSDIRSMINFIQLNQHIIDWNKIIVTNDIYEKIHSLLINKEISISQIIIKFFEISIQYNKDKRNILNEYIHFIIRYKSSLVSVKLLNIIESTIHSIDTDIQQLLVYFFSNFREILF